jgi:hypothetical protein
MTAVGQMRPMQRSKQHPIQLPVGAADQSGWEGDSKRPSGLRLTTSSTLVQIGRLGALENPPGIEAHARGLLRPMIERHMYWICRQPYLRAKRSMISLNIGSFTFSAACEAESHFTTRSCFSGHCLLWRLT